MKNAIQIILILLMVIACRPVPEEPLARAPIISGTSTESSISAYEGNPRSILVRFQPVERAMEYRVEASADALGLASHVAVSDSDYKDGSFNAVIPNLIPGWEYRIGIEARNDLNKDFISVGGGTYTLPKALPDASSSPDLTYSINQEGTSLTARFMTEAGLIYQIGLEGDDDSPVIKEIEGNGSEASAIFQISQGSTYTLSARYAYRTPDGSPEWADGTSIEIDTDRISTTLKIVLSDGVFSVNGIPEGTEKLYIATAEAGGLSGETEAVEGATITAASFLEPLEHGIFYAYAVSTDGSVSRSSNSVSYTEPLDVDDITIEERWQSVAINLAAGDSAFISWNESTFSITETESPSVPRDPSKGSISRDDISTVGKSIGISDLDSNTGYELSIDIAFTDGWRYTIPAIAFHTKSFAGTYEWVCPTGSIEDARKWANFAVTVEEGTETQYTIYTNEKDCFYTARYRLLPLVDGSVTSPIDYNNPAEEYKEANTAYDWNYRKWSIDRIAGLAKLQTWLPEMTGNYRDRTVTSVRTTTNVLPATTTTTWEFRENEQHQAEVVFTNKGSGLAASGIYSGPDKSNMFVLSCIEEAGV